MAVYERLGGCNTNWLGLLLNTGIVDSNPVQIFLDSRTLSSPHPPIIRHWITPAVDTAPLKDVWSLPDRHTAFSSRVDVGLCYIYLSPPWLKDIAVTKDIDFFRKSSVVRLSAWCGNRVAMKRLAVHSARHCSKQFYIKSCNWALYFVSVTFWAVQLIYLLWLLVDPTNEKLGLGQAVSPVFFSCYWLSHLDCSNS